MPDDDAALWVEIDRVAAQLRGLERSVLRAGVAARDAELRAVCLCAGPAASAARADAAVGFAVAAAVDAAHQDWVAVFAGLPAAEGKRLASESRGQVVQDNRSLTYGEVRGLTSLMLLKCTVEVRLGAKGSTATLI
jgi:hypothetical protein